jgi:hypothetical protein
VVEDPLSYRVVPAGSRDDLQGCRPIDRLKITRHATATTLDAALPPDEIRARGSASTTPSPRRSRSETKGRRCY